MRMPAFERSSAWPPNLHGAALEVAGVRKVRFHDLRHTFGTLMAGVGTPMRTLQEWMGHADHDTTLIYADYRPDEQQEAELIARAFHGVQTGSDLRETESNSEALNGLNMREGA